LNELKEQSEKEIREKNENILRLNNLLNDNFEKQSQTEATGKLESKQLIEQIEK
jgi:hypothetical protein